MQLFGVQFGEPSTALGNMGEVFHGAFAILGKITLVPEGYGSLQGAERAVVEGNGRVGAGDHFCVCLSGR